MQQNHENQNTDSQKILKNSQGKILFVGTLRQIKRRLKKIFKVLREDGPLKREPSSAGPSPFLLWEANQIGYTIESGDSSPMLNVTTMDSLKEKLKEIPHKPGVYQFKDKDGEVLYVGKAKDLKSRVSQYLNGTDERPQLPYLIAEAADISYTVVNNELESLYLENTIIKQYLPRYNIQLRDDKNYAFITIDYDCEIPRIGYARKVDKLNKKTKYYGPYSAAYKIRNTLNLMRRIFPYCAAEKVSNRPCFYYYLHRCPGVCIGKISLDEYRQYLKKIENFLAGDTGKIKKELENEMKIASSLQEFEKAARLRDQCNALQLLEERQTVIMPKAVNWDIVSVAFDQGYTCINLFKIREGKLQDKENFVYETDRHDEIMQIFLEQYYLDTSSIPQVVYTQIAPQDPELIEHIIYSRCNKKTKLITPQKGKPGELVKLGQTNALEHLQKWLKDQAGHLDAINNALAGLKDVLHLKDLPQRIECYDISNIQGTNAVGSMVVFKNGLPAKSEYRKFKIKTKKTPDDFAMMKEILSRRMARAESEKGKVESKWPIPDLIVIDGGKGQLSAALEVLQKFEIRNLKFEIPVIGLAKRIEEIFRPENPEPIILSHDNPSLQLLQRLRDEAHRFGITFHRALRSKQAVKSALDDIPGIGPKTKKLLKQKFGTVANIRKASHEDLSAAVGDHIAQLIQQSL
jgi:excinuclease ABC subunit C